MWKESPNTEQTNNLGWYEAMVGVGGLTQWFVSQSSCSCGPVKIVTKVGVSAVKEMRWSVNQANGFWVDVTQKMERQGGQWARELWQERRWESWCSHEPWVSEEQRFLTEGERMKVGKWDWAQEGHWPHWKHGALRRQPILVKRERMFSSEQML